MGDERGAGGVVIDIFHVDGKPDFAEMAITSLEREDERFEVDTATPATGRSAPDPARRFPSKYDRRRRRLTSSQTAVNPSSSRGGASLRAVSLLSKRQTGV